MIISRQAPSLDSQSGFIFPDAAKYEREAAGIVARTEMIRNGHWLFAGGEHAEVKADFDFVSNDAPSLAQSAGLMTAQIVEAIELNDLPIPDIVVAPPKGAEVLGEHIVALLEETFRRRILQVYVQKFSEYRPVRFWVTDPASQTAALDNMRNESGYILGVEDVTTTWGSTRGAIRAVMAAGRYFHGVSVKPMAMASFAERTGGNRDQVEDPIRLSTVKLHVGQWSVEDCLLCRSGVPIDKGSGTPASRGVVEQVLGISPRA